MAGDFVAIEGPSGSGKSTVLNIMGLLTRPSTGEYFIEEVDTATLGHRQADKLRAHFFGFIFQSSHCIPTRTALANVGLALMAAGLPRPERTERSRDALETVGLSGRANALCGDLSGGERQRVAIARALATRPRVILADEPTGNLDADNTNRVVELLARASASGVAVVVITHDADVARRTGRRVRLRSVHAD